jgi:hypothetical protein
MHNWQEYAAGTDPTAAGSTLKIEIVSTPPDFRLAWPSVLGRLYTVDRSTNAVTYDPIATDVVASPPTNAFTDRVASPGTYFYRVTVQP